MQFKESYLFEISWEVCNMVGGIYTVITSKLPHIKSNFENYYCMGAYNETSRQEFEEIEVPDEFKDSIDKIEKLGIAVHFGVWKVDGKTGVILVEYLGYSSKINDIKIQLWEKFGVDSLGSSWYDYDEVILWSWACGVVIEKLMSSTTKKAIVHCHEWMSGGALFYIKSLNQEERFKTVFTTHATMLGRALSGRGENLSEIASKINPDEYAYKVGVHTKHQTECALAYNADKFTTVSDVTSHEAKLFYGKEADVLLYNGFDNDKLDYINDIDSYFEDSRNKTNEFLKGYFHDFYELDTNQTQIIYTSGRNEFRNKGVDLFIESLGKLNKELSAKNFDKNIISLFLIPVGTFEKDHIVLESISNYKGKKEREKTLRFAPLSTHKVPAENEIIQAFVRAELLNREEDKVKVILVPAYLKEGEYFFDRSYYDVIVGLDLGVFASEYEPWGYTPLESISFAVPTVTSDKAGFGKYVLDNYGVHEGINVLKREVRNFSECSEDLFKLLFDFTMRNSKDLMLERASVKMLSKQFDWSKFVENYLNMYDELVKN